MKSLRMLMINNEYPPLGGGTATINQYLLEAFSKLQHFQTVQVTSSESASTEVVEIGSNSSVHRIPIGAKNLHHASSGDLLRFTFRGLILATKLQKQHRFDLIFAWSGVPSGVMALVLNLIFGTPYVVRVVGPDIPGFEARYRSLYPILRPLILQVWKRSSLVIAKCAHEKKLILEQLPKTKCAVLYNGIDVSKFKSNERATGSNLVLLCVARLIERKGIDVLLRALQLLASKNSQVRLRIVGKGDAEEALKKLSIELELSEHVEFPGYVSRDFIHKEYSNADIFVLPSRNEGMSVATIEAMASGLPCIVTRDRGLEELVIDGANGFTFEEDNIEELASKISLLTSDHQLRSVMGAKSKELSLRFTLESMVNSYDELLQKLASNIESN